jgi:glutaconate CoA-transferase subunit B
MELIREDERMSAVAARSLRDGEACFVGIGVPSVAALLAKHTHAPDLALVYESGAYGTVPPALPMSTGSPSIAAGAACLGDCALVFGDLQAGRIDVAVLSAAQVDRRGNLNSTVIGDYRQPKVRLVGSGGAHDIASLVGRTIIVMPHDPRRFVERVDFATAPGFGDDGRRPAGTRGRGPVELITPRGRFGFPSGQLTLEAVQTGFEVEQALEGFGWQVPVAPDLIELEPPAAEEVEIMRRWTGET